MRKSMRVCFGIVLVLALVLGLIVWNANSIVERFRPNIENLLSETLKTQASFGSLRVQFLPEVAIDVRDLTIGESKTPTVKKLLLKTSLSELLRAAVTISTFTIEDANLDIVIARDGSLSIASVPIGEKRNPARQATVPAPEKTTPPASHSSFAVTLEKLALKNINLRLLNDALPQSEPLELKDLSAEFSQVDTTGAATVDLHGTFLGPDHNVQIKGRVGNPLQNLKSDCTFVLRDLDLSKLAETLVAYQILPENLLIHDTLTLESHLKTEEKNLVIESTVNAKDAQIMFGETFSKEKDVPFSLVATTVISPTGAIGGKVFAVKLKSTNLDLPFSLEPNKTFHLAVQSTKLPLEELAEYFPAIRRAAITGTVSQVELRAQGKLQNVKESVAGTLGFIIEKGAIQGVNLLAETLGKLKNIPGLAGSLSAFVPEQYQSLMQGNATPFDELNFHSTIGQMTAAIDSLTMSHPLYIISGTGAVHFNGDLDLHAKLKITSLLAQGMVLKQPKLKLLLDQNDSLVIPVIIKKEGGRTSVLPDASDLLERGAKNTAKEAAGRALNKVSPGLGEALKSLLK